MPTGRLPGFQREGFSERQIEANRFVVSFAGNTVTSRDTVERYLLFHAAEVTLRDGYDYFLVNQSYAQFAGIKLFYDKDSLLMTPQDVVGLDRPPDVVIYQ